MGMPAVRMDWTAAEAIALPEDGNRYEVLDGELFVTPAPSLPHQGAVGELFLRLAAYVVRERVGWAFLSPADIVLSPRRLVQPDLFVVPGSERRPAAWAEIHHLALAVEILSPRTARADRHRKRVIYQSHGVPEYWIVDLDARLVERWRPDDARPEILTERLEWRPRAEAAPFALELREFFDAALGPAPDDDLG